MDNEGQLGTLLPSRTPWECRTAEPVEQEAYSAAPAPQTDPAPRRCAPVARRPLDSLPSAFDPESRTPRGGAAFGKGDRRREGLDLSDAGKFQCFAARVVAQWQVAILSFRSERSAGSVGAARFRRHAEAFL